VDLAFWGHRKAQEKRFCVAKVGPADKGLRDFEALKIGWLGSDANFLYTLQE
jgi:hypothetical protein